MQPPSTEMPTMNVDSLLNLPEMHNPQNGESDFDPTSSHDDFIDQILSSTSSFPWEFAAAGETNLTDDQSAQLLSHFDDQSALLASKLRHNQIGDGAKALMHQQQLMLSGGVGLPAGAESGLLPVPSSHNGHHDVVNGSSEPTNPANEALHNALIGSLGQTSNQPPHFHHPEGEAIQAHNLPHNFGAMNQSVGSGGGTAPQAKPRVRARRGQATDPHSIAERLRRERIAERMKALQELVPNANKTDKASMLDEIIDYVKFLQLQVKVLSMSRMGNAAAVLPRVADISAEGRSSNSNRINIDGMNATEQQVAKLLEQDMGSAMQYLQGKGLCLMPISLANAVSTATRNPMVGGPTSPSLSALTVQSTIVGGRGGGEAKVKDTTSVTSKS